jgi:hypothetical protein
VWFDHLHHPVEIIEQPGRRLTLLINMTRQQYACPGSNRSV